MFPKKRFNPKSCTKNNKALVSSLNLKFGTLACLSRHRLDSQWRELALLPNPLGKEHVIQAQFFMVTSPIFLLVDAASCLTSICSWYIMVNPHIVFQIRIPFKHKLVTLMKIPSNLIWLVDLTILKNMSSSVGMMTFPIFSESHSK